MASRKTVFVGLSGGVDSSVAALRLKKAGHNVVGVFIKVWHPDFMVCNWERERLDAMRVAAHLEIPFLTCDAEEAYKTEVADYFISEYIAGRTPNPDVMCNKAVKFNAFLRFAEERGADYIATGHYAQKINEEMHRGVDANKDQTYFLWSLTNEQLQKSLFPVGSSPKEIIRREAEEAGIPVATKKDSQGICFLGHVDIPEFISHYTTLEEGELLDTDGTVVGTHQGALVYTIGQRHGFTLTTTNAAREGMYIVDRNLKGNTVTVSNQMRTLSNADSITLENIVLRKDVSAGDSLQAQFRYRQEPRKITIVAATPTSLTIRTDDTSEKPSAGQSCVLYRDSHCIGGGIIS